MVLQGTSRLEAWRQTGMDRQTLRYNEVGVFGIAQAAGCGAHN
jgi:hypothetical protein